MRPTLPFVATAPMLHTRTINVLAAKSAPRSFLFYPIRCTPSATFTMSAATTSPPSNPFDSPRPSSAPSDSAAPTAPQWSMGTVKTDTPTVLTSPHPHVSCFSRPFQRFGIIPVGGRSTAIQLQQPPNQGSIWVLASTPYEGDAPTQERIAQMGGKVKYIIAPDNVHSLYTKQWADAFPEAKCIGVEGLDKKRPEIKWAGLYGVDAEAETSYGFEREIEARYFPTFANKDVAFFHKASRSLITADLIFNMPAKEQYLSTKSGKPSSPIPFLASLAAYFGPYSSLHSFFLGTAGAVSPIPKSCCGGLGLDGEVELAKEGGTTQERKERFAKDAEAVAAWDFDRIIMCHGDIVEGDGKKAWISAFKKYLTPAGKSLFSK